MPSFKVTLDVSGDSEEVVESWCVKFLKDRGFNVVAPNAKWETATEFRNRLIISWSTMGRKLKPWPGRPNVIVQYGNGAKRNRVLAILSNSDFDAYCIANK